jgi:glycosyltransferase involved in cell wall biosynthesis
MNIWIIHHYANTPYAPGDARHFSHARELIRRGHSVRIVACSFHHLTHDQMLEASAEQWVERVYDGVPFTWIRTSGYKGRSIRRILNMFAFSIGTARRKWAKGLECPDVIMGSTPHPFAALAAERLAAHYKVPFILEVRDPWPYVLTEIGGRSRFHPFIQLVDRTMRFLYRRASAIIMFSRDSTQLLASFGADPGKIVWIPQGIDLAMCPTPRLAPDDGVFTVSYIGAHNEWNSLDAILDAAKILQSSKSHPILIRFVGDGDSKQKLINKARSENILNVRFDPPVPKKDIRKILEESDAFIMNNRKDEVSRNWMSFSKLYEYLAAGRPVIFGSWTQNDPVSDSGAGISVPADDPEELAEAIRFIAASSPQELARYGKLGRSYIEQHNSIPVLVDRFEALIGAVTGLPLPVESLREAETIHA